MELQLHPHLGGGMHGQARGVRHLLQAESFIYPIELVERGLFPAGGGQVEMPELLQGVIDLHLLGDDVEEIAGLEGGVRFSAKNRFNVEFFGRFRDGRGGNFEHLGNF